MNRSRTASACIAMPTGDPYEETTPHKEMKEQLTSNDMSCLTCHTKIHDVANIDKTKNVERAGGMMDRAIALAAQTKDSSLLVNRRSGG